jgi:hypothetical protein
MAELIDHLTLDCTGGPLADPAACLADLSALAVAAGPAGPMLWLGTDETVAIRRGSGSRGDVVAENALIAVNPDPARPLHYRLAAVQPVGRLLPPGSAIARDDDGEELEIDVEGMDIEDGCLWLTGSHSSKRRRPRTGGGPAERLSRAETEASRFLIARFPLHAGQPVGDGAAALPQIEHDGLPGNALTEALADDPHLAPFLQPMVAGRGRDRVPLPGKDNGLDVEGLAVNGRRLWLGLRGPVLRGWAVLLGLAIDDSAPGRLALAPAGRDGRRYRKLFLHLGGMGVRDLCFDGDDLLILAGPTMDVDGTGAVWRLHAPDDLDDDTLVGTSDDFTSLPERLERLFDLPAADGCDKPEGLALFAAGGDIAALIVYDDPCQGRRPSHGTVHADLFRLPRR